MEFKYTARSVQGQIQKGTIEAVSKTEAVGALHERNLIILELLEVGSEPFFSKPITLFQRVKPKEIVVFSRQLATLFAARISLLESLRALGRQTTNRYFSQVIFDIANEVEGGSLFSIALGKYPKIFSSFFVNMVRSGEVSGGLYEALEYLADYLEKQYYLNSKIRGAMIYPAFIFFGFIVVGILMIIMVVPQLASFLQEAGQEIPLATKMLIWTAGVLTNWWWLLVLLVISLIVGVSVLLRKSPATRDYLDYLKLKIPIFRKIFSDIYVARMADNLSTLIHGGLPILQALQISAEVVGNAVFRNILLEAQKNVRIGNSISFCFERHKEIPPMVTQMVATGEKTGRIEEILKKLSTFYTKEVDAMVANLSQLIEPVLIIVLGIGVAFMIASILIPIYNIASGM